jgi:HD superfamily phosphohydrolase
MTRTESQRLIRDLSRTWVLQRLKHISVSAVPRWIGPNVATATRYEHSLGVGELSLLVSGGKKHDKLLLTAIATLHDIGNGPFPHISDPFMKEILGFTHERAMKYAFDNSPLKDYRVLNKYKLDINDLTSVLDDNTNLASMIKGFPDLDNADNIFRFITTIPHRPIGEAKYNPKDIGAAFNIENKNQDIPDEIYRLWLKDYERVYSYLWNDSSNMIGWTMLGRALRILKSDLTPSFFRMTNKQAFNLFQLKLPELVNRLLVGKYRLVFNKKFFKLKGEALKLTFQSNILEVENMLCEKTGLKKWELGLTVDQPQARTIFDPIPEHWRIYLVSCKKTKKIKNVLEKILECSKPLFEYSDKDN